MMNSQAILQTSARADIDPAPVMELIRLEMELLDQRRFEEWIELFTEDGYYWAPVKYGQEDPFTHVSLFFDDVRTMKTRVARLRHPRIHVQTPPSRTIHIAGNFHIAPDAGDGMVVATCNFMMIEFRKTKSQNLWGGSYEYRLKPHEGGYKIARKKAALVNSDDQFPSLAVWF